jgi:hypothetical protein
MGRHRRSATALTGVVRVAEAISLLKLAGLPMAVSGIVLPNPCAAVHRKHTAGATLWLVSPDTVGLQTAPGGARR